MVPVAATVAGALGVLLGGILVIALCVRINRRTPLDEEEAHELNPMGSEGAETELPPAYETIAQQDARLAANGLLPPGGRHPYDPFEGDRERERRLRKLVRRQLRAERQRRKRKRQEAQNAPPGYEHEGPSSDIPTPEELIASIRATREAHDRGYLGQRSPSSDIEESNVEEEEEEDSASEAELQAAEDDAIRRMMDLSPTRGDESAELQPRERESSHDSRSKGKRKKDRAAAEGGAEASSSPRIRTKSKDKEHRKGKAKDNQNGGMVEADEVAILAPTAAEPGSSTAVKKAKYKCLVLKEFVGKKDGQLTIKPGDVILVTKIPKASEGFWQGVLDGEKGYFPCTPEYIEVITV